MFGRSSKKNEAASVAAASASANDKDHQSSAADLKEAAALEAAAAAAAAAATTASAGAEKGDTTGEGEDLSLLKKKEADPVRAMCDRLVSAADEEAHTWSKVRELKNPKRGISHISINKRKLAGSPVAMIGITMVMKNVPPQVALRNVIDLELMRSWAQACATYDMIHRFEDGRVVLRGIFKFPYPMNDREMGEVRAVQYPRDNDLGAYIVVFEAAQDDWDCVPPTKPKLTRGHTFLTGYIIRELEKTAGGDGGGGGGGGGVSEAPESGSGGDAGLSPREGAAGAAGGVGKAAGAGGGGAAGVAAAAAAAASGGSSSSSSSSNSCAGCTVTYISYADVKVSVPSFVLNKVGPNIAEDFVYQFAAGCEAHMRKRDEKAVKAAAAAAAAKEQQGQGGGEEPEEDGEGADEEVVGPGAPGDASGSAGSAGSVLSKAAAGQAKEASGAEENKALPRVSE